MVKNENSFLIEIKELKLYIIEFNKNGITKAKKDLINCIIRSKKYYLIIIIIYDKYIFFAKNWV